MPSSKPVALFALLLLSAATPLLLSQLRQPTPPVFTPRHEDAFDLLLRSWKVDHQYQLAERRAAEQQDRQFLDKRNEFAAAFNDLGTMLAGSTRDVRKFEAVEKLFDKLRGDPAWMSRTKPKKH